MEDKVKVYYNPMSRGSIVHWTLEEVGAPYEFHFLDWKKRDHKSPEYLKINPMGKIPAIVHKGVVVTESSAIVLYLADAFSKNGLAPAVSDPRRGEYYRWFMFAVACIEPALIDRKYPRVEKIEPSHLSYGTFDDAFGTLEKAVSHGYLLKDKFTAADIYLSSLLNWTFKSQNLEGHPELKSYVARCQDRPSYQRYVQQVEAMQKG